MMINLISFVLLLLIAISSTMIIAQLKANPNSKESVTFKYDLKEFVRINKKFLKSVVNILKIK